MPKDMGAATRTRPRGVTDMSRASDTVALDIPITLAAPEKDWASATLAKMAMASRSGRRDMAASALETMSFRCFYFCSVVDLYLGVKSMTPGRPGLRMDR